MESAVKKGYVGNPDQLRSIRRVTLGEGRARGTEVIEVTTSAGLQLDVLPCSGLDVGQVRFCGVNMTWLSKNGYDGPSAFIPYEDEFLHTFSGGLLYTCGLRSAGPQNRDGGEYHPLHGRYHGLQAEQVCAEVVDGEFVIRGVVRETALFGHALELRRTIRIPTDGASVTVEDELTNQTPRDEEIMQLYHCNFGYPLLSEKARLILPESRRTTPRTEFARTGLGSECEFVAPVFGEEERVFFHEQMEPVATLQNPELGVEMSMTWSADTLPVLAEWRSMAGGDYVLGLEPSNSYIMGRSAERENGTLPVLKGFETRKTMVRFTFKKI